MVTAAGNRRVLQEARNNRRGVFANRSKLQGQRPYPRRACQEVQQGDTTSSDTLRIAKGVGSATKNGRPGAHCF